MTNMKALSFWRSLSVLMVAMISVLACSNPTVNEDSNGGGTSFAVSFDVGEGSGNGPLNQSVISGGSITLPGIGSMIAPSGKEFDGWSSGGQNYKAGDTYTVNGDTVFVAQWVLVGNGGLELSGTISITPSSGVSTGTKLTANYTGSESISYQWKVGNNSLGTGQSQTAMQPGSYTVTISASGYNSKTSSAIQVTGSASGTEGNPFSLTEGVWEEGELTTGVDAVWYSFTVTSGTTYNLWCNGYVNAAGGDGNKTADIQFEASYSDGSGIFNRRYIEYESPESFTASKSGTVVLKGVPWSVGGTGTYAIGYSVANTDVTLNSVVANGSSTETTTQIALTFNKAILLTPGDLRITMGSTSYSLAAKTIVNVSGTTYTVDISSLYVEGSQATRTMSVVVQKNGYAVAGSPKTATIYYVIPSVPTGVQAVALSSSSIQVSWNAVSGADCYKVAIANDVQATSGLYDFSDQTSATSIIYTGLNASKTYHFKVKAYNGYLSSQETVVVSATTQSNGGGGGTVPTTPQGVNAVGVSAGSITVSWSSVSGATGYYIYQSASPSGTYSQVGYSTTTSYTNTGLLADTAYYYKVAAYNAVGTGSYSSVVSATTQSGGGSSAPITPDEFIVSVISDQGVIRMMVAYPLAVKSVVDTYTYYLDVNDEISFIYNTAPNYQEDVVGAYGDTTTSGDLYGIRISEPLTLYPAGSGTYKFKIRIESSPTEVIATEEKTITR